MSLHTARTLSPVSPGTFSAQVPPSWAQGRAAFGGLIAALVLDAIATEVQADRPLRGVVLDFVAPVAPGPVELRGRVLRSGRALTQGSAEVVQGGQVCAVLAAAWGAARPTRLRWPADRAPAEPPAARMMPLPYLDGVTPTFTQHFQYRWASERLPFSGAQVPNVGGLVRLAEPGPVDAATILALVDAWPAPVLATLDRVVPASTVTWAVNLVQPPPPGGWPGETWFRFESDTVAAGDGYADIDSRLWAPDGTLVATSRQLVVEFSA